MDESTGACEGGPEVDVVTPTGDAVRARLLRWQQADDGTWWALCSLTLWSMVDVVADAMAEPYDVEFRAPAGKLQRLEGEDYGQVRRLRSRSLRVRRLRSRSGR
jgi:hypothetical protein